MQKNCYGVKKRVTGCNREIKSLIGYALTKKGWCGNEACRYAITQSELAALESKLKKSNREQSKITQADKLRIMPLSTLCSKVQHDVNAMIRAADIAMGYSCIATGATISDAGHFYHAGTKYRVSWLRFFHANIHGQGTKSNRYAGGGDALNYMEGIIKRYGHDYLKDLQEFKRATDSGFIPAPTKEELTQMASWCREMTRIYKNMQKD